MKRIFTISSFTLICTIIFAQPSVSTYVGTGTMGHVSGTVSRKISMLDRPYGVAMDSKGNLWLSEEGTSLSGFGVVVRLIIPDGSTSVRAGKIGNDCFANGASSAAKFSQPRGLAVDASDNIYVADYGNNVIRKISPYTASWNAQVISVFAGKYGPDTTVSCYQTYTGYLDGTLKNAMFNGPSDIAIDKTSGAMYIADANNNCIRKILNSQVTTLAGHTTTAGFLDGAAATAKFSYPTGVFVDASGDVYVADHNNQRIRKISGGIVSTVVPVSAGLWTPDDVWVMANGDIYITDQHRIRKYSGTTLTTFAGSSDPQDPDDIDGFGTAARFHDVKCLITHKDSADVFYVADQENHKIRKVVNCTSYKPAIYRYGGKNVADTSSTCTGDTIYLEAPLGYKSYSWSTGEKTYKIFKKGNTDNITCTTITNDGCQGVSDDYYVRVSPLSPRITANGPTTFCPGDSILLTGTSGYDHYKWIKDGITFDEGGQNKISIRVHTADIGTYILTGTLGACVGNSSPLAVSTSTTIVPDFITLQGAASLCDNDTLKLEANGTFATYSWKKGTNPYGTTKSVNITTAGTYTLSVTSTGGCSGTSLPLTVTIIPSPAKPTITVNFVTQLTSSAATSYQWYKNGVLIPDAVNQIYTVTKNGDYHVVITGSNSCKAKSDPTKVIVSILELSNDLKFELYPNPTTGKLNVNGTLKTHSDFNIRIVDLMGKSVYNNTENLNPGKFEKQIDLQGKASGIYFVIISSDGKQGMMKLILK